LPPCTAVHCCARQTAHRIAASAGDPPMHIDDRLSERMNWDELSVIDIAQTGHLLTDTEHHET
jgi:hypothetical protein